jgi:hypothetical protein
VATGLLLVVVVGGGGLPWLLLLASLVEELAFAVVVTELTAAATCELPVSGWAMAGVIDTFPPTWTAAAAAARAAGLFVQRVGKKRRGAECSFRRTVVANNAAAPQRFL